MPRRVGYLGPPGTFTEEAFLTTFPDEEFELVPYESERSVLVAVDGGDVDIGAVPIENSIEGSVNATLDALAFETEVLIQREFVYPIRHALLAKEGLTPGDISAIFSHPHAAAQCAASLERRIPGVPLRAAYSTADAARIVAGSDEPWAAVATELAANIYGLEVLDKGIEDFEDNLTRFILVGKEEAPPTGDDKTSLVCFIHENRPGSLLQLLQEFSFRYINLTKIESRPTKKSLGEYCFFVDLEGHINDENVASAMMCLQCKLRELKVLGSYPRARLRLAGDV